MSNSINNPFPPITVPIQGPNQNRSSLLVHPSLLPPAIIPPAILDAYRKKYQSPSESPSKKEVQSPSE